MTFASIQRLTAVACLGLILASSSRAAEPIQFLPDDCHLIIVTRVKEQIVSPAYKEIQKLTKDFGLPAQGDDQIKDSMGLDPSNVVSVTAGMSLGKLEELAQQFQNQNAPPMIMVAQTVKPATAADIKAAIKNKEFTESKVGLFTMYDGKDLAFSIVDNQTVVYGPPAQLKTVLERNKPAKLGESMTQAMKEMANPKSTAMAFALKELVARPEIQQALQGAGPQVQKFVGELEGVVLQVGMAQDIDVGLSVLMTTNKSADELRKMADGFLAIAKLGAGQDVPKEAIEIIDSVKLNTDGSKIKGSMAIKTASLSKLLKEAAKRGGLPQ